MAKEGASLKSMANIRRNHNICILRVANLDWNFALLKLPIWPPADKLTGGLVVVPTASYAYLFP
jgi:hypothetical protein